MQEDRQRGGKQPQKLRQIDAVKSANVRFDEPVTGRLKVESVEEEERVLGLSLGDGTIQVSDHRPETVEIVKDLAEALDSIEDFSDALTRLKDKGRSSTAMDEELSNAKAERDDLLVQLERQLEKPAQVSVFRDEKNRFSVKLGTAGELQEETTITLEAVVIPWPETFGNNRVDVFRPMGYPKSNAMLEHRIDGRNRRFVFLALSDKNRKADVSMMMIESEAKCLGAHLEVVADGELRWRMNPLKIDGDSIGTLVDESEEGPMADELRKCEAVRKATPIEVPPMQETREEEAGK